MDNVIHKSYTAGFKLTVVAKAEKIGNRAAAREFNVDEKCVRRWRTDKEDLQKMPLLKRAQRGGIAAWPDLERELESWIKNHHGKAVSVLEIQARAKLIAEQMGLTNFKGTINWCYRFVKRKQLPINSKTIKRDCHEQKSFLNYMGVYFKLTTIARAEKIGNNAAAQEFDVCDNCIEKWRSNKDYLEDMQNFEIGSNKEESFFLESIMHVVQKEKLTDAQIISVDEIPFSFHFLKGKGDVLTPILTAGNEKLSFTCIISCAANGDRLKPFIVFKMEDLPQVNYPTDVVVRTSLQGEICENVILDWLYEVWRKRKGAIFDPRGILIIDFAQKKPFESVRSECEKMSTTLALIPKGLKKLRHPLSFLINKTFEHEMVSCYEKWVNSELFSVTKRSEMRMPTPNEIAEWVIESWKSINVSIITYGFTQAGIISFKECANSENIKRFAETENSCDNDCEEIKEDVNACVIDYEEIKEEEDADIYKNGYEKVGEINNRNGNEKIREDGINKCGVIENKCMCVNKQGCICDSSYGGTRIRDVKTSDQFKETIGINEFLKQLFKSDSNESKFEGY